MEKASLLAENLYLTGPFRLAADALALQGKHDKAVAASGGFNDGDCIRAAVPFRVAADALALKGQRDKAVAASGGFKDGDCIRAAGLQSRPDLNGTVGKLVRFYPEKGRWAVQFSKTGNAEPILLKVANLQHGVRVCNVVDFASSEPQFATSRGLDWAGRKIRLFGIRGYSSNAGSDEIYYGLQSFRPGVVLMESFDVRDKVVINSGDVLPYREVFPSDGLAHGLQCVASSEFRRASTAEAVAVLSALQIDAEVRLCDRLHTLSFDRLISRLSLLDLKHALVNATELVGQALETIRTKKAEQGEPSIILFDLPQNFICPLFPELGIEREQLMGHFARCAAEQGNDVAIVVGVEHLAGIVEHFEMVSDANLSGTPSSEIVEYHLKLLSDVTSDSEPGDSAWNEEIEKRSAVAAFLSATLTFPAGVVLPPVEHLQPEVAEVVKKTFPKYKQVFGGRVTEALGGVSQSIAALNAKPRLPGLAELHNLCSG